MGKQSFKDDFIRRVSDNKPTRWIRFGIVSVIFFAWVAWMGNWWLALLYILLFDIYITGYIPFTWWKKSKNKTVRTVMSWVDAIVYALILVYFIFAFVGQNYMIPTSSLEKTLLTGDYLWVNKMVYGPRVPMTPVHFPLVHNKLPILNCKSYTDWPQNEYHRLKGLRDVEMFDIVVFNFPAGDTVAMKTEEPGNPIFGQYYEQLCERYGRDVVNSDKARFGDIVYRPVDRRENYVKRAVGLPGDTFKIVKDTIYVNGKKQPYPEHVQFNYIVSLSSPLTDDLAHDLGIARNDYTMISEPQTQLAFERLMGLESGSLLYFVPLTQGMIDELTKLNMLNAYVKYNEVGESGTKGMMYPNGFGDDWTISDWGGAGVIIPKKGMRMKMDEAAWQLYGRCIRSYENNPDATFRDGKMYIGTEEVPVYTFKMDYYFMMGDNRDNSLDSRFWGFVPEDHVVGTPIFVLASFDQDRSLFSGGLRTDRIFIDANPDK